MSNSKRHLRRKIASRVKATINKLFYENLSVQSQNKTSQNINSLSSSTMSSYNQTHKLLKNKENKIEIEFNI